jgi:hypothetical protein
MCHEYNDTIFKNSQQKESEEVHATQRGMMQIPKCGLNMYQGGTVGVLVQVIYSMAAM